MYSLLIALAVLYVLAPIILLVLYGNLRVRLGELTRRIAALESGGATPHVGQAASAIPPLVTPQAAPPPQPAPSKAEQPEPEQPKPASVPPVAATSVPEPARDYGELEKRFGTQWVVWIGGLALALGGIFLVRYSIEAGLLGPGVRVMLGALLALALVGAGEFARRREDVRARLNFNTAHIPSVLTAAGTAVAYADIYAAYALYQFLPPALAFILLGAVALGTLAAALVHGPALAGLGLVGAYLAPMLVASDKPNFWALYLYLAVVTAAAYALAMARLWRWLALTAAIFSVMWMLPAIASADALTPHAFHAIAGYALAAILIVPGLLFGPDMPPHRGDQTSSAILALHMLGATLLLLANRHDALTLFTIFALCGATIAIAWRTNAAIYALPAAAVLAAIVVLHGSFFTPGKPLHGAGITFFPDPDSTGLTLNVLFAATLSILFAAGGFFAQGRSLNPQIPVIWAATGVITPLVMLIALYVRIADLERSFPFAAIALLMAAVFGVATEKLDRMAMRAGGVAATAIFACGAIAALALALTFTLDKGWLSIALALMVPGIAFVADKRPLPMLRTVCAILTALVTVRIAWEPRIAGAELGTTPIFNWLLWGYGVPALAFWGAGYLLRRRGDDAPVRVVEAAAILFTVLTVFLQIRHFMTGGNIYRDRSSLAELGLHITTGLAMTIGLEWLRRRSRSMVHSVGALVIGLLTTAAIVLGLGLLNNPLVTGEPVGGPFINSVLLAYGIPALLMAILARMIRDQRSAPLYVGAAIVAIALALAYLTLEVRTIFHGPVLSGEPATDAEQYTYSAVWLAFGVALLLAGIALKSQPARLASAAVVTLTVAKVFLYDLAGVQGVYRALSFICLGLVLMGIGWLYQRLLFTPRRPEAAPADVPS